MKSRKWTYIKRSGVFGTYKYGSSHFVVIVFGEVFYDIAFKNLCKKYQINCIYF